MPNSKKRRATIIYENQNGILLTRISNEPWLLPGGHAEHSEPRIIAAIRELYEETKLKAIDVQYLFDFESTYYHQKVFLIKADGIPEPSNEVSFFNYYHPLNSKLFPEISKSSLQIIQKYLEIKNSKDNK
jgi:8-oxo-dGTP pyrophosphatase MutT (NUDIX family)